MDYRLYLLTIVLLTLACLVNRRPRHWQGIEKSQFEDDGDLPYKEFEEQADNVYLPHRDFLGTDDNVHLLHKDLQENVGHLAYLPEKGLERSGDPVYLPYKDLKEDIDNQHRIYKREVSNDSDFDPNGVATSLEYYKSRVKRVPGKGQGQKKNSNNYNVKTACVNPTTEVIDECLESVDKKIAESCVPGISKLMDMMNQPGELKPGPYQMHANESETCIRYIFSNCSYDSKVQVKTKLRKIVGINLDIAFQEEFEMDACTAEECAEDFVPNIENCLKDKRSSGKNKELCKIEKGNISTEILEYIGECIEDHMSYSCIMQSRSVFDKSISKLLEVMQEEALNSLKDCNCDNDGKIQYNHTRLCMRWIDSGRIEPCGDTLYEYIKRLMDKRYDEAIFKKTHTCLADTLKVCPSDTIEVLCKIIAGAFKGDGGQEPEPPSMWDELPTTQPPPQNPCSKEKMGQYYKKVQKCVQKLCVELGQTDKFMDIIISCVTKIPPPGCKPHKASDFIIIGEHIGKIIYKIIWPDEEDESDERPPPEQPGGERPPPEQPGGERPPPEQPGAPRPPPKAPVQPQPPKEKPGGQRPSPGVQACVQGVTDKRMRNCLAKLFLYVVSFSHAHYTQEARDALLDKAKICFQVTLPQCSFDTFVSKLIHLYSIVIRFTIPPLHPPDIVTRVTIDEGVVWCGTTIVSTHVPVTAETYTRVPSIGLVTEEMTETTVLTPSHEAPRRTVTKWYPSPSIFTVTQSPPVRTFSEIITPTTYEDISIDIQTKTERRTFPTVLTEVVTRTPPTTWEEEQKTATTFERLTVTLPRVTKEDRQPLPKTTIEEQTPPTKGDIERLTPTTIRTYRPTWPRRTRTLSVPVPTPTIFTVTPTEAEEFTETRTRATTRRRTYPYPTRTVLHTRPTPGTEVEEETPTARTYTEKVPATTIKYYINEQPQPPNVVPKVTAFTVTEIHTPEMTTVKEIVTVTPVVTESHIPSVGIEVTCWNYTIINFWLYENPEDVIEEVTIPCTVTEVVFTPDVECENEVFTPTDVQTERVTPPKVITDSETIPATPFVITVEIIICEVEIFTQATQTPTPYTIASFPCDTEEEYETPRTEIEITDFCETFTTAYTEKATQTTYETTKMTPTHVEYTETQRPTTIKFNIYEFEYDSYTPPEEERPSDVHTYETEVFPPTSGSYTERETPSTTKREVITLTPTTSHDIRPTPPTQTDLQTVPETEYTDVMTKSTLGRYTQTIPPQEEEDYQPTVEGEYEGEKNCNEKPDRGPCSSCVEKWYYNSESQVCQVFIYGGCKGNGNQYSSESECLNSCGSCTAKPEIGPCRECVEMWYFSSKDMACLKFTYGGCEGNSNRYKTEEECMQRCQESVSEQPTTVRTERQPPDIEVFTEELPQTTIGVHIWEMPQKEKEGYSEAPTTIKFSIIEEEEEQEVMTETPIIEEKETPPDRTEEVPPAPATRFTVRPTMSIHINTPAPKEVITHPFPQATHRMTFPSATTKRIIIPPKRKGTTFKPASFTRSTVSMFSRTIPAQTYQQTIKSPTTVKVRVVEKPGHEEIATATDYKFERRTYPPKMVQFTEEITPETPEAEEDVPIPECTEEEERPIPSTTVATFPPYHSPVVEDMPHRTTRIVDQTEQVYVVDMTKKAPVTSTVKRLPRPFTRMEIFTKSTIQTPRWTPAPVVQEDNRFPTTIRHIGRQVTVRVHIEQGPVPTTEKYEKAPHPVEESETILPTSILPKTITPPVITYARDKEVTTVSYTFKEEEVLEDQSIGVFEVPFTKRQTNYIPRATTKHYSIPPARHPITSDQFTLPTAKHYTVPKVVKEQHKTAPPTLREVRTFPTRMQTQTVPRVSPGVMQVTPETEGYECMYPTTEKPETCGIVKKPCKPSYLKKWIKKIRKCVGEVLKKIGKGIKDFFEEGKMSYDELEQVVTDCIRKEGDTRCRNTTFPAVEKVFDKEYHTVENIKEDALKNCVSASDFTEDVKQCVALIDEEKLEECYPGLYKILSNVIHYRKMSNKLEVSNPQADCLPATVEHCETQTRQSLEKELKAVLGKCIKFTKPDEESSCKLQPLSAISDTDTGDTDNEYEEECKEGDFDSFVEDIKSCFDKEIESKKKGKPPVTAVSAIQILTECRDQTDPLSDCIITDVENVGKLFLALQELLEEAVEDEQIKGNLLPRFSGCFTGILDIISSMEEYEIYENYIKKAAKECLKPAVKGFPPETDKVIIDFYLAVLKSHVAVDDKDDQGYKTTVSSVKRTRRGVVICANQLVERLNEIVENSEFDDDCVAVGSACNDYHEDTKYVILKSCNKGQAKQWIYTIEDCVVSKATSIGLRNPDYLSFKQIVVMLLDCIDRSGPLKCRPKVFDDFQRVIKITLNIVRQNTISGEEQCKKELKEDSIPKKCYRTLHRYLALRKDCSQSPSVKSLTCLKSAFKSCPEQVAKDMLKSLEIAMLLDEESLKTHQGEFQKCTPEHHENKVPPVYFRSAASDLACGPGGVLVRKFRAVNPDSELFQSSPEKGANFDVAGGGKVCLPTEYNQYFEEIKRCGERRLKLKLRRTRHECHKNDFIEYWDSMTECMIENIGLELTCKVKTQEQMEELLLQVSKTLHVERVQSQNACPKVQRCYGDDEPDLQRCSEFYFELFQSIDSTDLYLLQIFKRVSKLLSCLGSLYPDCTFDTLIPSLSFVYLPLGKNYDSGIKKGLNFVSCENQPTREKVTFPDCMAKERNTTEDVSHSFATNCSSCVRVKKGICLSDNFAETIKIASQDYSRIVPCLKQYITNEKCLYYVTDRIKNYCLPEYHSFIKGIKNGIILNSVQHFWKFNQCLVDFDFRGDCPEGLKEFISELFYEIFGLNPTMKPLLQAFRDSVIE